MTQQNPSLEEAQQAVQQQAWKLLSQVAGYVGVRTMEIGLRLALLWEVAKHPHGITTDDQLMPTQAYIDLLSKHGFRGVGAFDLTPVHAVTYGQR